ncbi:MAG: CoA transferase [Rhodocyclaceae bacterium]|nr:CoA transferase [Rhodocyclaceae bacterium]
MGALSGLFVVDLSRVLAGPWASMQLADLGAEVVKIERPGMGDETRSWGPPWFVEATGEARESAYYLSCNRNKRSLTVDFTRPEGQAIIRRLVQRADVLIENFKVGGLAPYGLDDASLRPLNPRLIYCSITGFGQQGPYAGRPGYDFLIQAMGGLMSITGRADGEPGAGPQKVGVALTDILTGLYATIGILAALYRREQTGLGQYLDLALLDVQIAALANQAMNYLVSGKPPKRLGNAHPNIVPYQDFPAADGDFIIAVGNDAQFARLAEALGRPEWARDVRFSSNAARVAHRAELVASIAAITQTQPRSAWLARLMAAGVPCGPINDLEEVFADPQVRHRGMAFTMFRDTGFVPQVASPLRLSATPVEYRRAPPRLGEDTDAILAELGYDALDIQRLKEQGVV